MEINKQLFEDVLSGKLKGTFVLKNKLHIEAKSLMRSNFKLLGFLYKLHDLDAIHAEYTEYGKASDCAGSNFDIIDFIPETNMKEEKRNVELTLEKAKEWYKKGGELREVALQAFKEEELKDTKPRRWEEYCKQQVNKDEIGFYIEEYSNIEDVAWADCDPAFGDSINWRNVLPSKELAEAFLAMMQLMSLRQAWIGDWEPDWTNSSQIKYCIQWNHATLNIFTSKQMCNSLSFPTEEMAKDFKDCFKDLLEKAKGLY